MPGPDDVVLCFGTCPPGRADALARALVDERLAACVNAVGPIRATYRWQGAIEVDEEHQLWIETTRARLPELEARYVELHPYTTPKLLVLEVARSLSAFDAWVRDAVGGSAGA